MKTLRLAALVAALLPVQLLAQQNPISYSYIGLGYQMGEIDATPTDVDTNGMTLDASMEVANHGHLFGEYGRYEYDGIDGADGDMRAFGGGVHFDPFERFSVYGRLGFVDASDDVSAGLIGASGSGDGLYLAGGVRYMVTDQLELRGSGEYYDLDTFGEEEFVSLGGDFYLTDLFTLTFGVDVHDDANVVKVGARIYPTKDPDVRR